MKGFELIDAIDNCRRVYLPYAMPHLRKALVVYAGWDLYYLSDNSYGLSGVIAPVREVSDVVESFIETYYPDSSEEEKKYVRELMLHRFIRVEDLIEQG